MTVIMTMTMTTTTTMTMIMAMAMTITMIGVLAEAPTTYHGDHYGPFITCVPC